MYTAQIKSLFLGSTQAQRGQVMDQNINKHSVISKESLESPYFPTWCPGCGNFGVWTAFKNALAELNLPEENVVIVYGVGCSGNMADFNRVYGFHALHGRAIPTAEGIKMANQKLKVIVVAGDGDTYGEGLNHFITACRGNHDITLLVHDNQIYGLTTGQASPTTEKGIKTKSTPNGTPEQPINPIGLALTADATFVARGFAGNISHLTQIIKAAITHEGFSLVDMFQPCFTFNHHNTYHYFKERIYDLQVQGHDPTDRFTAWKKTHESDKLPVGIFYQNQNSVPLHKTYPQLQETALTDQSIESIELGKILSNFS
jgi:2-oxoglutarate/2-oxoacid ferredoxin oxidoreductase subunit beta